jgi:steroid delta-isomerase
MNAAHIRKLYDRYIDMVTKGDVDGIVALYADDATLEDPIGSELRVGLDAVRDFYSGNAGTVTMKRTGPVRVAGTGVDAATPIVVLMGPEGQQKALDIISVMTFDQDGKITTMRAWWNFDDIRPATEDD